jgi:hypothetical protein
MSLEKIATALMLALAASVASAADPVARLGWLQGCWQASGAETGSGEQWMAAAGGTVLGMSRTVRKGVTTEYEFLQIREVEPGKLAYIAMPSGRAPTTFTLLRESDTEFVFENLGHDFPQRIIYKRDGDKVLNARIEGSSKGKAKGIDFPMKRVSCDAAAT